MECDFKFYQRLLPWFPLIYKWRLFHLEYCDKRKKINNVSFTNSDFEL